MHTPRDFQTIGPSNCITQYTTICCRTFPSAKHVDEVHVYVTHGQDIHRYLTLSISISWLINTGNLNIYVCTVKCTKTILRCWYETNVNVEYINDLIAMDTNIMDYSDLVSMAMVFTWKKFHLELLLLFVVGWGLTSKMWYKLRTTFKTR